MTIYHVAKTGNNTNAGTQTSPWLTIQKAASTMVAGDTVYIHAGTYNEVVIPVNSGSLGSEIIYSAYTGDERQVIVDVTGINLYTWNPVPLGIFSILGTSNIKIKGLALTNSNSNGILIEAPCSNIEVNNC